MIIDWQGPFNLPREGEGGGLTGSKNHLHLYIFIRRL